MKAKASYHREELERYVSNPLYDIEQVPVVQPQVSNWVTKNDQVYQYQSPSSSSGIISSQYHKMSSATIRQGERCAIWDEHGRVEFVDGPAQPFLYHKTVERLRRFQADENRYLIVKYLDGRKEHIPGPHALFFDPVHHESISITHCINLNLDEAIVVYRNEEKKAENNEGVQRSVIYGPALYMPSAYEWIQEFSWGGQGSREKFVKLRLVPEQLYVDVNQVRTTDDALLTLNFMIVFQLTDIQRMLSCTHDPIADFTTALCSDVVAFTSKLSFDAFKGYADSLNEVATYVNLKGSSEKCGFKVVNVVFRGYQPTAALLYLQEQNVHTRTQLQLEKETEEQKEQLRTFKQHSEFERARERHEMELSESTHKHSLKDREVQQFVDTEKAKFRQQTDRTNAQNDLDLEYSRKRTAEEIAFLTTLRSEFGVDVTEYLLAKTIQKVQLP